MELQAPGLAGHHVVIRGVNQQMEEPFVSLLLLQAPLCSGSQISKINDFLKHSQNVELPREILSFTSVP